MGLVDAVYGIDPIWLLSRRVMRPCVQWSKELSQGCMPTAWPTNCPLLASMESQMHLHLFG